MCPEITLFDVKRFSNLISLDLLNQLKEDFYKNCTNTWPGRRFYSDLTIAQNLLQPILQELLPGDWIVDGGNYFETDRPYRLHCDSGKHSPKHLYYNIVIPIEFWADQYNEELNKLIITDQKWYGDAAFFVKGDISKNEYNICITDYDEVENLQLGFDKELIAHCDHLNQQNLEGFSVKSIVSWNPGDIILFKRNFIHVTSNWKRAGVHKKLGLSLFTSYNIPGSI
jgi:hypothetical protein